MYFEAPDRMLEVVDLDEASRKRTLVDGIDRHALRQDSKTKLNFNDGSRGCRRVVRKNTNDDDDAYGLMVYAEVSCPAKSITCIHL